MLWKLQLLSCFILLLVSAWGNEIWKNDNLRIHPWKENDRNSISGLKKQPMELFNCEDEDDCIVPKKESKRLEPSEEEISFSSSTMDDPILNYIPSFVHKQPRYCSCAREKRLVDLGPDYFPRYYSDMVCISGGCGSFQCRPKRFKLWVMRKRHEEDTKPSTEPIPHELRDQWIGENVITTTDCECRP